MKKPLFLTTCIVTQLILVTLYIHKSNRFTQQLYRKQELELAYNKLTTRHATLVHDLYCAKNQEEIKDFAQQKLAMNTLQLKQVKILQNHD